MAEKKSERLEVRLGYSEKEAFVEACDTQGDTPSGAVRRFIAGYTRRADGDLMEEANRRLLRRYAVAASLLSIAAMAFMTVGINGGLASFLSPELSEEDIFSAWDRNSDDLLVREELMRASGSERGLADLMRVLDLDASGDLSQDEFQASGRMVYVVEERPDVVMGQKGESYPLTVVEFQIDEMNIEINLFRDAIVNAGEFDRFIIWYEDGTHTLLKGGGVRIETANGVLSTWGGTAVIFPPSVAVEPDGDGAMRVMREGLPAPVSQDEP